MRHSLALALSTGAVIGTTLIPAAAVAATSGPTPAAPAFAATALPATTAAAMAGAAGHVEAPPPNPRAGSDPPTIVTFAVTSGALTLTAPSSASLGSGTPGTTITGLLGIITVNDNRALLTASWTATVASTDFTTGGGTGNEIIPASAGTYDPGTVTKSGTITITSFDVALSSSAQTVVTGTAGVGNNTANWNPTISLLVPPGAVGGTYTGTVTHSVS